MSLASDLAAIYADPFLTVPVRYGAHTTRGYFDVSVQGVDAEGVSIGVRLTVLRVQTAALPGLREDDDIVIGLPGDADTTANGRTYRVRQINPVTLGLESDVLVAR